MKNFHPKPVDVENDFSLSYLKPFFDLTEGDNWHLFDLVPILNMVRRGELKIDHQNLLRAIKGSDALCSFLKLRRLNS